MDLHGMGDRELASLLADAMLLDGFLRLNGGKAVAPPREFAELAEKSSKFASAVAAEFSRRNPRAVEGCRREVAAQFKQLHAARCNLVAAELGGKRVVGLKYGKPGGKRLALAEDPETGERRNIETPMTELDGLYRDLDAVMSGIGRWPAPGKGAR